jgi:uncharacterized protein YbjQ (UPF0145 family)
MADDPPDPAQQGDSPGSPGELDRIQADSIARLERGLLPVEAEERLHALRDRPRFFTSDLSVDDFALGVQMGVRPISQVMGTCVYHASIRADQSWTGWAPGRLISMEYAARPWNEARSTAFRRMGLEARECGADAVIGVRLTRGESEFEAMSVEFLAVGTAVKVPGAQRAGEPVLTALSAQEYWLLGAYGHVPVGVVAHTEIVGCVPSISTQQSQSVMFGAGAYQSREYAEFSQAIRAAIGRANDELARQAHRLGGDGVIGARFNRAQEFVEREQGAYMGSGVPSHRTDLIVVVHAIGTAILTGEDAVREPHGSRALTIMPVRHLDPSTTQRSQR